MTASVNKPLIAVAGVFAFTAAALAFYIAAHPFIPADVTIEDDIQSINWGPLALTFPIFSWIGDFKGAALEVLVFVIILLFNRRAWILAAAASSPNPRLIRAFQAATRCSSSRWLRF